MDQAGRTTWDEIVKWMELAKTEGQAYYDKGNKAAGRRARKALDQVAKLKVSWRKQLMKGGDTDGKGEEQAQKGQEEAQG